MSKQPLISTSNGDYVLGKYVYPIGFTVGLGAFFIISLFLYLAYGSTAAIVICCVSLAALLMFIFSVGQQLRNMEEVSIFQDGIEVKGKMYSWSSIKEVKQVFIFRIEFIFQDKKITMPIPFGINNFNYPADSELIEEIRKIRGKAVQSV